ncbi:hypothetical protein ACFLT9_08670 [Acidobacteriota bacterium]
MKNTKINRSTILLLILVSIASGLFADTAPVKKGVFEYVIRNCTQNFDEASTLLEEAIGESAFQLLAKHDQAPPETCEFKTRVFILLDSEYAKKIIGAKPFTAPFGVADRINLFEDEEGVHISIVNPENINRTILMEDTQYNELSDSHRKTLRELITGALTGEVTERPYGPIRKKGYIGRTMGVMAGGPFDKKIQNLLLIANTDLNDLVDKLKTEFNKEEDKWGTGIIYSIVFEEEGIAVLGVSSPKIESKSFSIVKAGGDKSRKSLSFPGIAHAGAYPIEIVIERKLTVSWVRVLDIMYRMKMYFEDAGKVAFAVNMGMPGSIQREIKRKAKAALQPNKK